MNREEHYFDENGQLIRSNTFDVSWTDVRAKRDQLLADTDWRAMKDRVLPGTWKEYRQALRDITEHPDPNSAADAWPHPPE